MEVGGVDYLGPEAIIEEEIFPELFWNAYTPQTHILLWFLTENKSGNDINKSTE